MARPLRLEYEGALYHVTARGNAQQPIYLDDTDRKQFLQLLGEEIDQQREDGKESFAAILDSAVSRLRPVSMAAATTILGLIPLLQDVFFVNMAITIMAGLGFATILTLVIVPVLYAIFFQIPYTHRA